MTQSFLDNIKDILVKRNLEHYKNLNFGIDANSWVIEIIKEKRLSRSLNIQPVLINVFEYRLELLINYAIKPIIVFGTWNQKQIKLYPKCSFEKVTNQLYKFLQQRLLVVIISPNSSCAQLTYLVKKSFVDIVMTNDQQIIAFGAKRCLLNLCFLKKEGYQLYYSDLPKSKYLSLQQFDQNMFLTAWIISCSKYTLRIPHIGIKSAFELVSFHVQLNYIMQKCKIYSNSIQFPLNYEQSFLDAILVYRFGEVQCFQKVRQKIPFNEIIIQNAINQQSLLRKSYKKWDGDLLSLYMKCLLLKRFNMKKQQESQIQNISKNEILNIQRKLKLL